MPVRMRFGTFNNLVIEAGFKPYKPYLSEIAKKNTLLAHKGKRSFAWKGGRHVDKFGYVQVWRPEHPNAKIGGYIHEHRLIMSEVLGRPLKTNEQVHHKNKNRQDNRAENLHLITVGEPNAHEIECPSCSFKWLWR